MTDTGWTTSDWINTLIGGAIVTAGATLIAALVRKFWNPVRWKFTQRSDDVWDLERVSGVNVFAVCFGHPHSAGPTFYNPGTPSRIGSMDMKKGLRLAIHLGALSGGFWMFWVERGRRRLAWVEMPPGTNTKEVLRRDAEAGKSVDEIFQNQWAFLPPNMF